MVSKLYIDCSEYFVYAHIEEFTQYQRNPIDGGESCLEIIVQAGVYQREGWLSSGYSKVKQ
jgi:hypothetical protein